MSVDNSVRRVDEVEAGTSAVDMVSILYGIGGSGRLHLRNQALGLPAYE